MLENSQTVHPVRHTLLLLGLILLTPFVPILNRWPWGLIFAVGVSFGIVWAIPSWRYTVEWNRFGKVSGATASVSLLTALVSALGLVIWYRLCSPDLTEVAKRVPMGNGFPLILMGALFACLNATLEEIACRGVLQDALTVRFGVRHSWWIQGLVFGSLHGGGVPQGMVGIVLASIYGVALGWIRQRSEGIGLCCIVHVCTDAVIFALLVAIK